MKDLVDSLKSSESLVELITNKNICFCGPSPNIIDKNYGKYIDTFDNVCRVNLHITPKKYEKDYGKKTDIMFLGAWPVYDINVRRHLFDYKNDNSKYNFLKETKLLYFCDPTGDKLFRSIPYKQSDINQDISWKNFEEKFKNDNFKYDFTDIKIRSNLRKYFIKKYNMPNYKNDEDLLDNKFLKLNSGINSILIILKHKPKKLFITGMNFYNMGLGGLINNSVKINKYNKIINNVYIPGTTDTYNKNLIKKNYWCKGHISNMTLDFFKNLVFEYRDIIELDDFLKKKFS